MKRLRVSKNIYARLSNFKQGIYLKDFQSKGVKMGLERFRAVYSRLPEDEKKQVVVVLDEQKISWETAFREIAKNSDEGKRIQKKLEELDII